MIRADVRGFCMPDCEEQIYSNEYLDFIISRDVTDVIPIPSTCIQPIDRENDTYFYPRSLAPEFELTGLYYSSLPKCFGLVDELALEVSGILKLQEQPALSLKGEGVLVGFIDTGVDYQNKAFRYADGSSKIWRIWDQTIQSGVHPKEYAYGSEYTREQINEALRQENPLEIVPSADIDGHGTFLAGVACGSAIPSDHFTGAAPSAEIAVVKLKEAKPYLKDFYFIPQKVSAYQENDIMCALHYLDKLAEERNMPLVICLGLGSNMGNRGEDGALTRALDILARKRRRCCVAAVGNEANERHHFQGKLKADMEFEAAELSVEENTPGFFVELWAAAPELYTVSVSSPTGELLPKIPYRRGMHQEYTFLFEQTTITIDYQMNGRQADNQLIYLRFWNVTPGIWTIYVYPQTVVTGEYHMWLPMQKFSGGNVFFLRPDPDQTITVPGNAAQVLSVGGYQIANGGIYLNSGRGFGFSGGVKPDVCAPAVDIYGPGLKNRYVRMTGTSAAAAVTAGACAQIMEWGLVRGKQIFLSSSDIRNMLIRGAKRSNDRIYPDRSFGWGLLDVYAAFETLRI